MDSGRPVSWSDARKQWRDPPPDGAVTHPLYWLARRYLAWVHVGLQMVVGAALAVRVVWIAVDGLDFWRAGLDTDLARDLLVTAGKFLAASTAIELAWLL